MSEHLHSCNTVSPPRIPYLYWGWIGSACLHAGIVCVMILFMKSCGQPAGMGQVALDYHSVGIYDAVPAWEASQPTVSRHDVESTVEQPQVLEQPEPMEPVEPLAEFPPETSVEVPEVEVNETPVENALPDMIGTGPQDVASQVSREPSATATMPAAAAPPPAGTVSFFNITDTGESFLFVIDMSKSMKDFGAFEVARREMQVGLQNLRVDQKFHIVFYNDQVHQYALSGKRPELMFASPVNVSLARNFINSKTPQGGTNHLAALSEALGYRPEVLYFLTDADQPGLNARELERVRQRNRGSTKIHAIEFGSGPDLDQGLNFLEKLAAQNGGS